MSLHNSSPTTMLHTIILTTQIGGIIQISPGSLEHLSIHSQAKHLSKLQNLEQAIVNLSKCKRREISFSTSPKPKGIHEVETHEGESSQVRDVKALITLRSGKKVELPTPKPHVEKRKKKKRQRRGEEIKGKKKDSSEGKEDHDSTVNANPEKVVIKGDDLCTIKRGLNVNKKAFLTEQVSAIIQCKSPLKYKDPGSYHFSHDWRKVVEKALLDLGASVNLLPYSVYKQLGLGELKPTSITLSLADRSEWTHATHVWQHDIGAHIFYMSKKQSLRKKKKVQKRLEEREEILPLFNKEEAQEAAKEETPKLNLKPYPERCLLEVLKRCKKAIGWQISDLKGISPLVCTHHIYMEEEAKPIRQPQRRLNPHMQEVVRAEVLKLLQAGEEVATHLTSGWRVCIDYRKLNAVTRKDHFPLPFIDQVLEKSQAILSIVSWTATPGLGAQLGEMPFYGTTRNCPWPYHLQKGIEVDKAKVELIVKLPSPTTVKGVRQFLGHAGFYRRFIKDFLSFQSLFVNYWLRMLSLYGMKMSKSFDQLSNFDNRSNSEGSNWQLPFEVMCDASDFAIGVVLGQREDGKPYVIYYASKIERSSKELHKQRKNFTGEVPSEWKAQDRKHFFAKIHATIGKNLSFQVLCRSNNKEVCPEEEQQGILNHCHESACGGHFASQKTAMKVLQSGFSWPSLFKDAHTMYYVSKWVEAIPVNTMITVFKFLKENIFSRFGVPKAIISDGGTHFCNKPFETLLAKYGVKHKNSLQDYSWHVSLSPSLWQSMPSPVEVEYKAWWAIKKVNMDLTRAGTKRCLDLNEMEELRNDAYINSKVAKQRMKKVA
ncbi:hypothetical protein CK203_108309 [Vitis vinifera]|uniref:Uncharacterized protein n=1 Tax=Vitis vinifera TaxID=29760 RepID=A0A438CCY6_VITVI|nr:hypothetical protein CK203_108309 [Vitis vinifera]